MLTRTKVTVEPICSGVGGEIVGFDSKDCDEDDITEVQNPWLQHGVLCFHETDGLRNSESDEMFQRLVAQGADVLELPATFTLQTGKDHWKLLIRAGTIERQGHLLAAHEALA